MTERTPLVLIGGVKKQLPVGDTLAKSIVGLDRADNTPDLEKPVSQPTQDALARKADLDPGGKVPAAQLPSYVDDVLEYNTFANLPNAGEAGKIYVTLDPYTDTQGRTSSQFRWTGSAYTPIIASPGTTDAVTEGSTNLYFTTNRVRQVLLAGLSTAVGGVIAATDNIMQALGKLQNQITVLLGSRRAWAGNVIGVNDGRAVLASEVGYCLRLTPAKAITMTLPGGTQPAGGYAYLFRNESDFPVTITAETLIYSSVGAQANSFVLAPGQWAEIASNIGSWVVQLRGRLDSLPPLNLVDNTTDLSKPVSAPTAAALMDTGGQNLAYNSAFLKVSANASNLADGWEFDGPGSPGNSTGVLSLVPSFISPGENAQRITATNLTTSSLYRSLVNNLSRITKVSAGQSVVASARVKGTAGLQMRLFIQSLDSKPSVISAPASSLIPLTGEPQAIFFAYPNLPANTTGVRVFYRLYAGATVTDGSVDIARPKVEVGTYPSGWTEDNIVIREDVASRAKSINGAFTGETLKIDVASTAIGAATGGNAGLELGSTVVGTATTPFVDFHSGSAPVDYDCRLLASGGNGTSGNGALTFAGIAMYMAADLYVNRQNQESKFSLGSNPGYSRYTRYTSGNVARWDFGVSNAAESGSNAGSDLYVYNFNDTGNYMSTPWGITRSTGETKMTRAAVSGPFKVGQYTLATLPSASAYEGYEIDVTDAAGGSKRCRSNRTNWLILNTTTPVS
jgi:hypothetical protein